MKKTTIIGIAFALLVICVTAVNLMIISVSAHTLNNDNYNLYVGIVSGKNLSNNNYKSNINIYPTQAGLSNNNYKLEVGYLITEIPAVIPEEIEPRGGAGSGETEFTLIEQTEECPLGQQMWNDVCYPCNGSLAQVGNDIVCVYCPDGFFDIKTNTCINEFKVELSPFFLVGLVILVIVGYIVGRRDNKKKEKRLKEQEEIIEERKKKENERKLI